MHYNIQSLKSLTILYAEDDPVILESIGSVLDSLAHRVIKTENGLHALKTYREQKIDIAILDIEIPLMSGLDVAEEIRKNDLETPILIITNHLDTDNLLKAVRLNLVDYLIKPINFQTLKNKLIECAQKIEKLSRISIGDNITYDKRHKSIHHQNELIVISKSEADILELLLCRRGMVVTYEMIEYELGREVSKTAIKSIVSKLRKKIGKSIVRNAHELGYFIK